jgi:hypothetical protein
MYRVMTGNSPQQAGSGGERRHNLLKRKAGDIGALAGMFKRDANHLALLVEIDQRILIQILCFYNGVVVQH